MGIENNVTTLLNLLKKSEDTQEQMEKEAGIEKNKFGIMGLDDFSDAPKSYELAMQNHDIEIYNNYIHSLSDEDLKLLLETYYVGTGYVNTTFNHDEHSRNDCIYKFSSFAHHVANLLFTDGIHKIKSEDRLESARQYL